MIRMLVASLWVALVAWFFGVFWGLVVFAIVISTSTGRLAEQVDRLQDELRNTRWELQVLREQVRDLSGENGAQTDTPRVMHRMDFLNNQNRSGKTGE